MSGNSELACYLSKMVAPPQNALQFPFPTASTIFDMISLIPTASTLCLHDRLCVYFPQLEEFDSPCITSAVCPVFSLWTTCTQRRWTGRECKRLCQRSLESARAGREICNTRANTSFLLPSLYSLSYPLLCVLQPLQNDTPHSPLFLLISVGYQRNNTDSLLRFVQRFGVLLVF